MKKRRLGKSDIYISELTLGCMSLGTDKSNAKKIIDTALEEGINHLDTADLYDFGVNEEIIGEIIKDRRKEIVLTTKVGNRPLADHSGWEWDPSKKYIMEAVKKSLKRLQTDYIDFYMLHGGTIDDPFEETVEAFEQLKRDGLIRAYGISSIRPNVIRKFVQKSNIDGVMLQYSLLDRRPEEEILNLLLEAKISVLTRGSLAKGMLSTNGLSIIDKKAANGYLNYSRDELLQVYNQIVTIDNGNAHELALRYVLTHPAISTVVFGASSVQQVQTNVKIDPVPLSKDLYQKLQALTKANQYEQHR